LNLDSIGDEARVRGEKSKFFEKKSLIRYLKSGSKAQKTD
jgi:hypothetical protein